MKPLFYRSMAVAVGAFLLNSFLIPTKANETTTPNSLLKPDEITQVTSSSINMIGYEYKTNDKYETVLYMPYYPAYAMVSYKTPTCSAELTGYVDPFALKDHKIIITYKKCKVSFTQTETDLNNPTETSLCQEYHPKECSFTNISSLKRIPLHLPQSK